MEKLDKFNKGGFVHYFKKKTVENYGNRDYEYKTTINKFEKWVDIISKKEWFDQFKYVVTGSFPGHLKDKTSKASDVDIILVGKTLDFELIKEVLDKCMTIAREECKFNIDIFFQREMRYTPNQGPMYKPKCCKGHSDYIENNPECEVGSLFKPACWSTVANLSEQQKKIGNRKLYGELTPGLYEVQLTFPSEKQKNKLESGIMYEKEFYVRDYKNK